MRMRTLSLRRTFKESMPGKTAVPSPQIEIRHLRDLGCGGTGLDVVRTEQEAEVSLHLVDQRVLGLRVCDPEAHHAHSHLHHLIAVRVVHEGAGAACHELVDKGLSGREWPAASDRIRHPYRWAGVGRANGRWCARANGWSRRCARGHPRRPRWLGRALAVEPHRWAFMPGATPHHGFGHQVELLDTLVHAPRQVQPIERDHRVIGTTRARNEGGHGVRTGLNDGLGQNAMATWLTALVAMAPPCNTGKLEKISSGCHGNRFCINGLASPLLGGLAGWISWCWWGAPLRMPARQHRPARIAAVRPMPP